MPVGPSRLPTATSESASRAETAAARARPTRRHGRIMAPPRAPRLNMSESRTPQSPRPITQLVTAWIANLANRFRSHLSSTGARLEPEGWSSPPFET